MKNALIFIVGPTAVGKTQLALDLAQKITGEIISCDALQVYREINVSSAKPSPADLAQVKHHCINLVSVTENFNVAQFRREALKSLQDILARDRRPIFVGGSGMYISALIDGIFEESAKDEALRKHLEEEVKSKGLEVLYDRLKGLDPAAAHKIHFHDAQRIIRALEVIATSQKPISNLQQQRRGLSGEYPIKMVGINRPRSELYTRVEERIDHMFEQGLVEEIEKVSELPLSLTAKTLIGIPEVQGYLKGDYNFERAKYLMKLHTRHYVKRQLTWFRRDERIKWHEAAKLEPFIDKSIFLK